MSLIYLHYPKISPFLVKRWTEPDKATFFYWVVSRATPFGGWGLLFYFHHLQLLPLRSLLFGKEEDLTETVVIRFTWFGCISWRAIGRMLFGQRCMDRHILLVYDEAS
jgi:hypothetical protein